MDTENIINQINESAKKKDRKLANELQQISEDRAAYKKQYEKMIKAIPRIKKAFKKERLEIVSFNQRIDTDKCQVRINAVPHGKQHQFIKHAGYDSSGRGKNQDRLDEKAGQLTEALADETGYYTSVNPYSFEKNSTTNLNSDAPDTIMIDIKVN